MKSGEPFGPPLDMESGRLNRRKGQHIEACLDDAVDLGQDSFARFRLRYLALPEIARDEVRTETVFAGHKIQAPLIISCMTGGAGAEFERINANLALGAEALGIPLGLGSMKVMLRHKEAQASFMLRHIAPNAVVIANFGLVSFNHGLTYEDVDRIVDSVRPDALGLHLNALQEAIQEGGDCDFRGMLKHLEAIARRSKIPVYVKECGGGIAPELVERLLSAGADYVDISGSGGTSWAAVEGSLSQDPSLGELFRDFGLPTAWILERLAPGLRQCGKIVASGGIRNGLQGAKALALGASYFSMARPFLIAAHESPEAVIALGRRVITELRTAMFLTGVRECGELHQSLLLRE